MFILGLIVFAVIPVSVLAAVGWCVYQEFRRDRIPILLYHRLVSREAIRAGRVPDNEPIYAAYDDVFAGQMEYLRANGYTTLNCDDLLDIRSGRMPLPPRPVAITFDDGYESNYTMAFPAIRRCGQKATIYVAPQPDEYSRNLVAGIDGFLTPDQMRELDRNGVSIESHTLTHCVLSELPDEQARHELVESKRVLSEILSRPVRHLAVPRSGYSRRIHRLAVEAGYETVCCNNKGSSTSSSDLMALPRIVIERDMSVADFARLLQPRTAAMLRIIGNLKRIPERLFGPTGAKNIRTWLYNSPIGGLFVTRRLKRVLAAGAAVYALACLAFYARLLVH
jgi:peptidoglycan/xylan/chitin deacetylase (PgdA/CDA1 family)